MSVTVCSPESDSFELPPVGLDAVPQESKAWRANELSWHLEPILQHPTSNKAVSRQHDLYVVNIMEMSTSSCSPVPNTALTPFHSPASACPMQTLPPFQVNNSVLDSESCQLVRSSTLSSVELDWLHTSQQRPWDVVNTSIGLASVIRCSPESKTEGTNTSPIPSETGRSQRVPSSSQDAPRLAGAEAQQRNL